jgi:hypothetical protein
MELLPHNHNLCQITSHIEHMPQFDITDYVIVLYM